MERVVIIGNSAGGKSTLARQIAAHRRLPVVEVDKLIWRKGWRLAPPDEYELQHSAAIAKDQWIIEGLGAQDSIPARIARSTEIVLIDLPLWIHFALAAERQVLWSRQDAPPAGLAEPPPTMGLFKTIWQVDQNWMPGIRSLCRAAEQVKKVTRLRSLEEIDRFSTANARERPG